MPEGTESAATVGGVAVVIVNFRTVELTVDAVRSVQDDPLVDEIVVVDNGSADGSVYRLRSELRDPRVCVVESAANLGFGRGVNLGTADVRSPYLFLLNSDAGARTGALAALRRVLAEDPDVGVVAPLVYQSDGRTLQTDAFGPMPAPRAVLRTLEHGRTRRDTCNGEPGWVSGVAMMLRTEDFQSVGGFDPDFVMYLEDVDLCRRLRAAGKRVAREPSAAVVHLGGRSDTVLAARADHYHRSKAVYLRKAGAGRAQLWLASGMRMARVTLERGRRFLRG